MIQQVSDSELEAWLDKSPEDGRFAFQAMLFGISPSKKIGLAKPV